MDCAVSKNLKRTRLYSSSGKLFFRYLFNGKITSAISKTPKFSRVPVEPGLFKIVSVAHQSNMCQTNVEGIQVKVRPIPIAKVSHGKLRAEDLREGEQVNLFPLQSLVNPVTDVYECFLGQNNV